MARIAARDPHRPHLIGQTSTRSHVCYLRRQSREGGYVNASPFTRSLVHPFTPYTMIYSMTGYAAAVRELESAVLSLELRSVNHRYLDVQFRLPDELRAIEPALRETIAARLNRGKVECRISFTAKAGAKGADVDESLLQQLVQLNERVRSALPNAQGLTAA